MDGFLLMYKAHCVGEERRICKRAMRRLTGDQTVRPSRPPTMTVGIRSGLRGAPHAGPLRAPPRFGHGRSLRAAAVPAGRLAYIRAVEPRRSTPCPVRSGGL